MAVIFAKQRQERIGLSKFLTMQELIEAIEKQGLSEEQAEKCLEAVREWLDENYPVAGTLAGSWLKANSLSMS